MTRKFLTHGAGESGASGNSNENLKPESPSAPDQLTFGQKACGVSFNPSRDPVVDEIKKKAAELVDLIHGLRSGVTGEAARYYSKAISHIEDGQMNAVKAATWQH